jgi:hypothetical protein
MCSAAVDEDFAGVWWAFEDVGFEACSGGNGGNEDFFSRPEVGCVHEIAWDFDTAFILHVGLCDDGTMEF